MSGRQDKRLCGKLVPIAFTLPHLLGPTPPLPHSQLGHFPCSNCHRDLAIRQSSASFPSPLLGRPEAHPKTRSHWVQAVLQEPHSELGPHGLCSPRLGSLLESGQADTVKRDFLPIPVKVFGCHCCPKRFSIAVLAVGVLVQF